MKYLTMIFMLAGCMILALLSGCAIDLTGSALSPYNQPPTCYLAAEPADILVGQSTIITCTASDVDSDAISYAWHAPTGCTLTGDSTRVQASPSHSGFFYISVTVSDKDGSYTTGIVIGVAQRNAPDSLWTRHATAAGDVAVRDIKVTPDGGYVMAGVRDYSWSGVIMVTDAELQPLWTAEAAPHSVFTALAPARDGRYIVVGMETDSLAVWSHRNTVSCYAPTGERDWVRQYGVNSWDSAYGVIPENDSIFVAWIGTELLWVTAHGDTLRKWSAGEYVRCGDLTAMPNGDIMSVAVRDSAAGRFLEITRLQADGSLLWRRQYRGYCTEFAVAASPTSDGGLVIGQADSMIRVSVDGDTLWKRSCSYGNAWSLAAFKDVLVDERGYLFVGKDSRAGHYQGGYLVVRTDREGNLIWYRAGGWQTATKVLRQTDGSITVVHGWGWLTKFAPE
jgi:hypothetical protein